MNIDFDFCQKFLANKIENTAWQKFAKILSAKFCVKLNFQNFGMHDIKLLNFNTFINALINLKASSQI